MYNIKKNENFVQVLEQLLQGTQNPILTAIDGKCAAGKTTLGEYLQQQFDCNLFHMDDFFPQLTQRTEERMQEIGGNVDYERFQLEVLQPLNRKEDVVYRPFDCSVGAIGKEIIIPYKRLNVIEGSYSQHPFFGNCYQLRVFMDISYEQQLERIKVRNGAVKLEQFVEKWIPKENAYFEKFQIAQRSDIVVSR